MGGSISGDDRGGEAGRDRGFRRGRGDLPAAAGPAVAAGDPVAAPDAEALDPAGQAMLRWLRRLVTGLALVMGIGILAIAAVLWLRLGPGAGPGGVPAVATAPGQIPPLPAQIALPAGIEVMAVTFSHGGLIVVGAGGEVLIFDRNGALRDQLSTGSAGQ